MTRQDIIVTAVEAKRKDLGMPCWRFAQIHLGISAQHYSMLKKGDKKFNATHLRALYELGLPADVLLGNVKPS